MTAGGVAQPLQDGGAREIAGGGPAKAATVVPGDLVLSGADLEDEGESASQHDGPDREEPGRPAVPAPQAHVPHAHDDEQDRESRSRSRVVGRLPDLPGQGQRKKNSSGQQEETAAAIFPKPGNG